jgi:hypothetical protein
MVARSCRSNPAKWLGGWFSRWRLVQLQNCLEGPETSINRKWAWRVLRPPIFATSGDSAIPQMPGPMPECISRAGVPRVPQQTITSRSAMISSRRPPRSMLTPPGAPVAQYELVGFRLGLDSEVGPRPRRPQIGLLGAAAPSIGGLAKYRSSRWHLKPIRFRRCNCP